MTLQEPHPELMGKYAILVNYDYPIEEMVKQGEYSRSDPRINSVNFPIMEAGMHLINMQLIHFGSKIKTREVLEELDSTNVRPATLPELLSWAEVHSAEPQKFPIVALGSWCDCQPRSDVAQIRNVAVLFGENGIRELDLRLTWPERSWFWSVCFAAVCK